MTRLNAFEPHDHAGCAETALAHAERVASERGLRLTPVRRRTLEILLAEHRALGAYEVLDRLGQSGFGTQPPVAYRALDFLVDLGLAHRVRRLNAFAACTQPGHDHAPLFFICENCDTVAEAPVGTVRAAADREAARIGFGIARMNVEAVGTCASCRAEDGRC